MAIYKTRYLAHLNQRGGDRIVKVCGGYTIMSDREYKIWKGQR